MQIEYRSNELCHYGVEGMKWGYTDGKPNGGRTAAEANDLSKYPAIDDVDDSVKRNRKDSRTIKVERKATETLEYGNYGPNLNTMTYNNKTKEKTYSYSKIGAKTWSDYTKNKKSSEETNDDVMKRRASLYHSNKRTGNNVEIEYRPDELYHYGKLGMKWGIRRARKKANKAVKKWDKSQKEGWKALSSRNPDKARERRARSHELAMASKKKADKAMKIISKIEKSDKTLSKLSKEEKNTVLNGAKEISRHISDNTPWADVMNNKKRGALNMYKELR